MDWTSRRNSAGNFVLDGTIYNLSMDMVNSLVTNGYYLDRTGRRITLAEFVVRPVMQRGVLHYQYIDTSDVLHNVWAETPDTLNLKLDLVSPSDAAGAAAWEYSFGNTAAFKVVKKHFPHG